MSTVTTSKQLRTATACALLRMACTELRHVHTTDALLGTLEGLISTLQGRISVQGTQEQAGSAVQAPTGGTVAATAPTTALPPVATLVAPNPTIAANLDDNHGAVPKVKMAHTPAMVARRGLELASTQTPEIAYRTMRRYLKALKLPHAGGMGTMISTLEQAAGISPVLQLPAKPVSAPPVVTKPTPAPVVDGVVRNTVAPGKVVLAPVGAPVAPTTPKPFVLPADHVLGMQSTKVLRAYCDRCGIKWTGMAIKRMVAALSEHRNAMATVSVVA